MVLTEELDGSPFVLETISSFAHHSDGRVRIVLHIANLQPADADVLTVRLRSSGRTVHAEARAVAAVPGARLDVEVPAGQLPPGTWRIAIAIGPFSGFRRVQARLLTSRNRPIALIPGPAPKLVSGPLEAPVRPRGMRRAAVRGGRLIDRVLALLPADTAAHYRSVVRLAARRVL